MSVDMKLPHFATGLAGPKAVSAFGPNQFTGVARADKREGLNQDRQGTVEIKLVRVVK
jgi:hypothetical protein